MSKLLYGKSVEFAGNCSGGSDHTAETSALRVAMSHPTQAKTLLLSSRRYKRYGPLPRNIRVASHETPIRSCRFTSKFTPAAATGKIKGTCSFI
jgi:hypothetical protein